MQPSTIATDQSWPALPSAQWDDTRATLHLWTQVVGKIRLRYSPPANHWWQVPLYVTCRGLTSSPIPYGDRTFQIDFDFCAQQMHFSTSSGQNTSFDLVPMTVAMFYSKTVDVLHSLGIDIDIWTTPVEIPDSIPFEQDHTHGSYDGEFAKRFWRVLVQSDRVMKEFQSGFLGKQSPVHFFWGSFDLAVTRFSGRAAPEHGPVPNTPLHVVREAYSHEVNSVGFWPGAGDFDPVYYAYMYPEPDGYSAAPILPSEAFYSHEMRESFLPYEVVRTAADPRATLLEFFQSTYDAGANLASWDRGALERNRR